MSTGEGERWASGQAHTHADDDWTPAQIAGDRDDADAHIDHLNRDCAHEECEWCIDERVMREDRCAP